MKKKLLAIAVGAAMAPAIALADGPTVYGTINLSYENGNRAGGWIVDEKVAEKHQDDLVNNRSALGVRGSSDLDIAGLTGFYQLEYRVDPTAQGSGLVNVESFVGLKGDFGAVQAGSFSTPTRQLGFLVDQFHGQAYGELRTIAGGELRPSQIIQYTSPKIADLLTVTYAGILVPAGGVDATGDGGEGHTGLDSHSLSLLFDLGDFYAGLSYDHNALLDADLGVLLDAEEISSSANIMRFVAGARMDALEFGFLYQTVSSNDDDDAYGPISADIEASDLKDTTLLLSVGFNLTDDIKLKAQWGETKASEGDEEDAGQSIEKATLQMAGVDYRLGRNTTAYFNAGNRSVNGDKADAMYGIGIKHHF